MAEKISRLWPVLSILLLCGVVAIPALSGTPEVVTEAQSHQAEIGDWRQRRHERLASDDGWLTLVGLEWLQDGENRLGKTESSNIRMPDGPDDWGVLFVNGDELRFVAAEGSDVTVDGSDAKEAVLVADKQGEPTVVRSGRLSFHVIFRESYALRIKDSQAPALLGFAGVDNYEIQADWRINGRFVHGEKGQTIEIGNVLGQLYPSPVFGTFEFQREGVNYSLIGIGDENSESLWFLIADRTSGHETYGAGRFLYSEGMPKDGRLVVDFNKAYNPPCAFNDYSTCPLPPQQNRLNLAITAGEKDYHSELKK